MYDGSSQIPLVAQMNHRRFHNTFGKGFEVVVVKCTPLCRSECSISELGAILPDINIVAAWVTRAKRAGY